MYLETYAVPTLHWRDDGKSDNMAENDLRASRKKNIMSLYMCNIQPHSKSKPQLLFSK